MSLLKQILKSIFFCLLPVLALSCGVKGRPQIPEIPPFIGSGMRDSGANEKESLQKPMQEVSTLPKENPKEPALTREKAPAKVRKPASKKVQSK